MGGFAYQGADCLEKYVYQKGHSKNFKDYGLGIVIECNRKIVNYLDVTLNLTNGTYKPYHKPDDETNYIHVESDYSPKLQHHITSHHM